MFTVEQRDALRDRVLRLAEADERVVAGAVVGSLALGGGDRFSDLDLTFAVADGVPVAEVLDDWTRTLADELDAVQLADLERGPTIYRVFLLPGRAAVRPLDDTGGGVPPRRAAVPAALRRDGRGRARSSAVPPDANDLFGWGVIYALHSRSCIERGRLWQAEHYVGAVRDHALALACLREGLPAVQARGYDDLSAATLARFEATHVGRLEPTPLRAAPRGLGGRAHPRGRGGGSTARDSSSRSDSPSFADGRRKGEEAGPPAAAARLFERATGLSESHLRRPLADPNADAVYRQTMRPTSPLSAALAREVSRRRARTRALREERVSLCVDLDATVSPKGIVQSAAVLGERRGIRGSELVLRTRADSGDRSRLELPLPL